MNKSPNGDPAARFSYSVKVINPTRKSEYVVQKLRINIMFKSVDEVRSEVAANVQGVPSIIDQVGFVEPGHGAKGRQRWLSVPEDLDDMYSMHKARREILLWCHGLKPPSISESSSGKPSGKRKPSSPEPQPQPTAKKSRSRYDNHTQKMIEVQGIEEELLEIHGGEYSSEQLNAWAHLIQMKKHESLETPPNKRFFRIPSGNNKSGSSLSVTVSPGKKVQLQGQLVDQLQKWHDLLEKGGINQTQYEEIQSNIMTDIKKF